MNVYTLHQGYTWLSQDIYANRISYSNSSPMAYQPADEPCMQIRVLQWGLPLLWQNG